MAPKSDQLCQPPVLSLRVPWGMVIHVFKDGGTDLMDSTGKPLILIGGGGHALSIMDLIQDSKAVRPIAGFLALSEGESLLANHANFLGGDDFLDLPEAENYHYIVAFGQVDRLGVRTIIAKRLEERHLLPPPLISRTAGVSNSVRLERGSVIFRNVVLNVGVRIGKNTHVNTGAIVEHGTVIGKNVMVSPGAIIAGNCSLGDNVFVGAGAVLFNNIDVGDHAVIAAGSVVRQHVPACSTYR